MFSVAPFVGFNLADFLVFTWRVTLHLFASELLLDSARSGKFGIDEHVVAHDCGRYFGKVLPFKELVCDSLSVEMDLETGSFSCQGSHRRRISTCSSAVSRPTDAAACGIQTLGWSLGTALLFPCSSLESLRRIMISCW